MSDPRRWIDDDLSLSPAERRVLDAGLRMRPPRRAKAAVLAGVLTGLSSGAAAAAGGAAGGAASAGGAVTGAVALSFLKPAAIGFALGAVTTVSVVALAPEATPTRPAPSVAVTARTAKSSEVPGHVTAPVATASAGSTQVEVPEPAPSVRSSNASASFSRVPDPAPETGSVKAFPDVLPDGAGVGLTSESKRVAEARSLLRNGDPRAALTVLERVRAEFPRGVLVQEREALAIEALLLLGDRAAARTRASAFLERFPASPHAAAARRALDAR